MIKLGHTARFVREAHGVTQKMAAECLGISQVHLCNIENNKATPSAGLLERYRELWQVDLYILAWCLHGSSDDLPPGVREASERLAEAWREELHDLLQKHSSEGSDSARDPEGRPAR